MEKTIKFGILGLLLFAQFSLIAQKGKIKDRIEPLKIAYITQKLGLTSEEAQKFWPVYNKFNDDLQKLRSSTKDKLADELSELASMSETDAEKTLNEMLNYKISEAEMIKKYASEFKKVLPIKKVVMLYKAENDFKRELLKKLRDNGRRDAN
jgi:hypothetical protein